MSEFSSTVAPSELVECPLCLGHGRLQRAEILDRLGMKDAARVAQLTAEEAFRLLLEKQGRDEHNNWAKFENELTRRVNEVSERHKNELRTVELEKTSLALKLQELEKNQEFLLVNAKEAQRLEDETKLQRQVSELDSKVRGLEAAQKFHEQQKELEVEKARTELGASLASERSKNEDLTRKIEGYLSEISRFKETNQNLEAELAKIVRVGKLEEIDFQEDARTWPGVWISDKLPRYGDYLLAFRDPSGEPLDPRMLVDNKDKDAITESDIFKILRDAMERKTPVAILLTREEEQLRRSDRERRWSRFEGIWLLRTTRSWVRRDLDLLRPILERMRVEGPDFLERNLVLSKEVRRSFEDLDLLDAELRKAARAIENSQTFALNYKQRLQQLCDSAIVGPTASEGAESAPRDEVI